MVQVAAGGQPPRRSLSEFETGNLHLLQTFNEVTSGDRSEPKITYYSGQEYEPMEIDGWLGFRLCLQKS
jgi:hypothetical protein